ncbi:hypothetical protein GQ53DRAFT_306550 [Thozetella sp. PMI_491]|nr:hypothetical protein GQ53DRAFT_306550 [Thozetella sp. PMI_491]
MHWPDWVALGKALRKVKQSGCWCLSLPNGLGRWEQRSVTGTGGSPDGACKRPAKEGSFSLREETLHLCDWPSQGARRQNATAERIVWWRWRRASKSKLNLVHSHLIRISRPPARSGDSGASCRSPRVLRLFSAPHQLPCCPRPTAAPPFSGNPKRFLLIPAAISPPLHHHLPSLE